MKKITLLFAMLATIVLSSCGKQGPTESTEVVVVEEVEGGAPGSIDEEEHTRGEAIK